MFKLSSKITKKPPAKFVAGRTFKILLAIGGIAVVAVIGFLIVRASPDYVSDPFTTETKIGGGTTKVDIATTSPGLVKLAECYEPNPLWTKVNDTIVRNIAGTHTATTSKDIYCDDVNCILWTDGAEAPTTTCIATDSNVYANILWSKTDSASKTWADSYFYIYIGDIGGTHASGLTVGNNGFAVGTKNWLERYYLSTAGTFDAMDSCKAKGSGWRLPNILELDSIRDQATGVAPYTRLPNMVGAAYWSSSEQSAVTAFHVNFNSGGVVYDQVEKVIVHYVRCVGIQ